MIKYRIRPLKTIDEFHRCEAIQKAVWEFTDREVIPVNELITIQRNGGLVLGAFNQAGRMLGFVFGFAGIYEGQLIHCSRMLAVLPAYRNSNIGYRLKLAQRAFARKQGIKLITWTFDPLQSLNAYFNIAKLGVIIRKYYINLYGTSSSILSRGLETDRFLAEWHLGQKSEIRKQKSEICLPDASVNQTHRDKDGWLVCEKPRLGLWDRRITVEIPADINTLKSVRPALARDWRKKTRLIFTHYFRHNYRITGFVSKQSERGRRSFYLLGR
jgi:predicted GNAT superfamily acetyltransferase